MPALAETSLRLPVPVRMIAALYGIVLLGAALVTHVPGIADTEGRAFGVFALDSFDDALHLASAFWAFAAAFLGHRAARIFLLAFGSLYLADGGLGLLTGSGYLDAGIFVHGPVAQPFGFRVLANLPHIGLGGLAVASGLLSCRAAARPA